MSRMVDVETGLCSECTDEVAAAKANAEPAPESQGGDPKSNGMCQKCKRVEVFEEHILCAGCEEDFEADGQGPRDDDETED